MKKDFLNLHYNSWKSNFLNITIQKENYRFKFNPFIQFSITTFWTVRITRNSKLLNLKISQNLVPILNYKHRQNSTRFICTIILTIGVANRYKNYISYIYDNIYLRESICILFSYRRNERKKNGISAIIANIQKFTSMDILYVSDKVGKRNKDKRKHDEIRGNKLGCVFSMPQCRHPVVKLTVYFVVPAH